MSKTIIHLAFADYQHVVRKCIISYLVSTGLFTVDIEGAHGADLIPALEVAERHPDICILDINMPVMNGYETIAELKMRWPNMKFLVLTGTGRDYTIKQMIRAGANGYLLKSCTLEELKNALVAIYQTGYHITDLTSRYIFSHLRSGHLMPGKLTSKEQQFLSLCCSDYTYKEIAGLMHVSPRTVDSYRDILFDKLDVKTRTGLVMFAISIGLSAEHYGVLV